MHKQNRICLMCGETHTMTLTDEEQKAYTEYITKGGLIQNYFPHMNPMEREFIKTGYCPSCQSLLFGTDYTSEKID